MPDRHSLHVALARPAVQRVRDQVAAGRYTTASEVLREASHLLIEGDARQGQASAKVERRAARHG